jgi:hypothetical protein
MLRSWRWVVVLWVAAALSGLLWGSFSIPAAYEQVCYENKETRQKECATYHVALVAFWHAGKFLDDHNGAFNAIFAGFVAAFTWRLWRSTHKLWEAGERQLRVAERNARAAEDANKLNRESFIPERRAWLTLEDFKIIHPTQFSETGARIKVRFVVKNLGPTPATDVRIDAESRFDRSGETYAEASERFKGKMRSSIGPIGGIIFPNDTLIVNGLMWFIEEEQIKEAARTRERDGRRFIGIMFFAGVSYKVSGDTAPHLTFFPYSWLNIPLDGKELAIGQSLKLSPHPFLAGDAD